MAYNALNTAEELTKNPVPTQTTASFSGAHPGFFRGLVISRDDPDKQGRIKVSLPHVYGDVSVDDLPWVYPCTSSWNTSNTGQSGANNGTQSGQAGAGGHVNVPPIGSPVIVAFEGGDHRYPMYFGGSYGKQQLTNSVPDYSFAANGNSPNNYSFTAPDGSMVQIDNRAGTQKILAIDPKGNYVSIFQTGLIEVSSKDTVSVKSANLVSIQCETQIETKAKQVLVYATGDLVVEGASSVNVNSDSAVNIQAAKINLNCGSSKTAQQTYKTVDTTPVTSGA